MVLVLEYRAEIAIRSLSRHEQAQVRRALDEIGAIDPNELCQSSKFQKFRAGSGETFYVYPGTPSLRLILSIKVDRYTIEDVIDRDKNLKTHLFDATQCRQEWYEFEDLLKSKSKLEERKDVLPFFKKRHDLSMLICNYFPKVVEPNTFAHEYAIYGDFVADLVVGDSSRHRYLLVEFENGIAIVCLSRWARSPLPNGLRALRTHILNLWIGSGS
jgi:hypothetical protein